MKFCNNCGYIDHNNNNICPICHHKLKLIKLRKISYSLNKLYSFSSYLIRFKNYPLSILQNSLLLLYGPPGSGKTTLTLLLANELKNFNIAYISLEESPHTLSRKIQYHEITNNNITFFFTDKISLNNFNIVIIDSYNYLQNKHILKLDNKIKFIICQITKTGSFKGPQELAHICDIVIRTDKMKAYIEKNRLGPLKTFNII